MNNLEKLLKYLVFVCEEKFENEIGLNLCINLVVIQVSDFILKVWGIIDEY